MIINKQTSRVNRVNTPFVPRLNAYNNLENFDMSIKIESRKFVVIDAGKPVAQFANETAAIAFINAMDGID